MNQKKSPSFVGFSNYSVGNISGTHSFAKEDEIKRLLDQLKYDAISDLNKEVALSVNRKVDSAISIIKNSNESIDGKLIDTLVAIEDISKDTHTVAVLQKTLKNIIVDILETGKHYASLNTQKIMVDIVSKIAL